MTWFRMVGSRLMGSFRRDRGDAEMDRELRFHLEMEEAENRRKGMSAAAARNAARRSFGNVTSAREMHREGRGFAAFETLAQDVRYGLRTMARNPGFTAVAVVTMALGIGVNSAIFSVTDAVLLRPLPYPEPDRVVEIGQEPNGGLPGKLSTLMVRYLRERFRSCEAFAPTIGNSGILVVGEHVEPVSMLEVSAAYFDVLGVRPAVGRGFSEDDEQPGSPLSAVLSDEIWRRVFAGNPDVLGESVQIGGKLYRIRGVMPPEFRTFPPRDVWAPFRFDARGAGMNYTVMGRLAHDTSRAEAQSELDVLTAGYGPDAGFPDRRRFVALDYQSNLGSDVQPALVALSWAVGMVLLIACANLACLLLARGSSRQKEIAMRAALGGGRGRIVRQLLTESVLLALLGGGLGVLFARAGISTLLALSPANYSIWNVQVDTRVLLATLAVSVAAGILFGLVPALETTRRDLRDVLQNAAGRASAGRRSAVMRRALVTAEVALCVVLLAGAGLLVRTLINLRNVELGFNSEDVLTARLSVEGDAYREPRKVTAFYDAALSRIRNLPGVEEAAVVNSIPVERGWNLPIVIPHGPNQGELISVDWRFMTPASLNVLGIPLMKGRRIEDTDVLGSAPVTLINQAFAQRFFGDDDPIGSYVQVHPFTKEMDDPPRQIVGIVGNVKSQGLMTPAIPTMLVPLRQLPAGLLGHIHRTVRWVVRTDGREEAALVPAMQQVLRSLDPQLAFSGTRTMDEVIDRSIGEQRFQMVLLSVFGALALVMAATGIYGLVAYLVASRRREIGVRMALGATRRDVAGQVIREGVLPVAAGAAVGLVASLGLAAVLQSFLFGVGASDPLTLGAVVAVILAVGVGASLIPAGRAVRISPVAALREE